MKISIFCSALIFFLVSFNVMANVKEANKKIEPNFVNEVLNNGIKKVIKTCQVSTCFYVNARSGLNFREKPKGKILGKFTLNTYVKVIYKTEVQETINDDGKNIKGTWVGVEHQQDTVYVFDGFLSENKVVSGIKLYYASASYKSKKNEFRTSFVNLSDSFFKYEYDKEGNVITKPVLEIYNDSKDTIVLNKIERNLFLKRVSIKESDSLFVYDIDKDRVTSFLISKLPVIACINIYFSPKENKREEFDYEFGFDLGKNFNIGNNIVSIDNKNSFTKGQLKKMIWQKINSKDLPDAVLKETDKLNAKGFKLQSNYIFLDDNFTFYLLNYRKSEINYCRYLVVLNNEKNQIIYSEIQRETESISLNPIKTSENNIDYGSQYTGKLFKNKAPVFFGFVNQSFGCPSITILDKTEPIIPILCDNRH